MKKHLRPRLTLAAGAVLLGVLGIGLGGRGFSAPKEENRDEAFARLERGMSPDRVRERLGPPRRVARQILYHRYLEQWIYDPPLSAHLEFDCPRGQKPQLVGKSLLVAPRGEPRRGGGLP